MAELEEKITAAEFIEWLAYMRLDAAGHVPSSGSSWEQQMKTFRILTGNLK